MFQAEVVVKNILSLISEKEVKETYRPRVELEGAIKLTLGIVSRHHIVLWVEVNE